ncbi:MAG: tetratricopeptide repeat protein [Bacteroidia bacterium]
MRCIIYVGLITALWGQAEIDSLRKILAKTGLADTTHINAYNKIAEKLSLANPYLALSYADSAERLAQKIRSKRGQMVTHLQRGRAYYYLSWHPKALEAFQKAASLASHLKDTATIARTWNNIAIIFEEQNLYDSATIYYQRAYEIAQKAKVQDMIVSIPGNLGGLYQKLGLLDSAQKIYLIALEKVRAYKNWEYISNAYFNLGIFYRDNGLTQVALDYLDSARVAALKAKYFANLTTTYIKMIEIAERQKDLPFLDSLAAQADREISDTLYKVEFYISLGATYIRIGNLTRAQAYLLNAIELSQNLPYDLQVKAAINLSSLYLQQALYPQALSRLLEAKRICENVKDSVYLPLVENALGELYYSQGDKQKALKYFQDATAKALLAPEEDFPYKVLANQASVLADLGRYEEALQLYEQSATIAQSRQDLIAQANTYQNMARVYKNIGKISQTASYLQKAINLYQKVGSGYYLAHAYIELGELNRSIPIYQKALQIAQEIENLSLLEKIYESLSTLYAEKKDYAKAYLMAQKLLETRKRLFNEENIRGLTRAELSYEFKKKEDERLYQEQLREKERLAEKQRQNLILLGVSIVAVLVLALAIVLWIGYQNKKRANEELALKNQQIEKQNQEIQLAYKTIEKQNQDILESIQAAKRIQVSLLPPEKEMQKLYTQFPNSFILYWPRDVVSGDFYYYSNPISHIHVVAAVDCTGHGVQGAFVSLIGSTLLRRIIEDQKILAPDMILTALHYGVIEALHQAEGSKSQEGMDVALGIINLATKTFHFAGAKRPLYVVHNGQLHEYPATRLSVGGIQDERMRVSEVPYTAHTIPLEKGMSFYLCSDGIVDQIGGDGKKFLPKRLRELLVRVHMLPGPLQKETIERAIKEWMGQYAQIDDICLVGVRYE